MCWETLMSAKWQREMDTRWVWVYRKKLIHFSLLFSPDDSELMNPGAGNSHLYVPLEVPFGRQYKDLIGAINYSAEM